MRHLLISGAVTIHGNQHAWKYAVALPPDPRPLHYLARGILEDALNGDSSARQLLLERTEGKVPMALQGSDEPDAPPIGVKDMSIKEAARIFGNILRTAELEAKTEAKTTH